MKTTAFSSRKQNSEEMTQLSRLPSPAPLEIGKWSRAEVLMGRVQVQLAEADRAVSHDLQWINWNSKVLKQTRHQYIVGNLLWLWMRKNQEPLHGNNPKIVLCLGTQPSMQQVSSSQNIEIAKLFCLHSTYLLTYLKTHCRQAVHSVTTTDLVPKLLVSGGPDLYRWRLASNPSISHSAVLYRWFACGLPISSVS